MHPHAHTRVKHAIFIQVRDGNSWPENLHCLVARPSVRHDEVDDPRQRAGHPLFAGENDEEHEEQGRCRQVPALEQGPGGAQGVGRERGRGQSSDGGHLLARGEGSAAGC